MKAWKKAVPELRNANILPRLVNKRKKQNLKPKKERKDRKIMFFIVLAVQECKREEWVGRGDSCTAPEMVPTLK